MIETDSNIIIVSFLGIDENDIDVDFFNNCIVIKGERKCLSFIQEEIFKRKTRRNILLKF